MLELVSRNVTPEMTPLVTPLNMEYNGTQENIVIIGNVSIASV